MKALFTLLALFFIQIFWSQQQNYDRENSSGSFFETVFDHYGNEYALKDIKRERSDQNKYIDPSCNAGMFRLTFTAGSGFEDPTNTAHNQRRAVICQVFSDLSDFINSPLHSNGNQVEIWVRDVGGMLNGASPSTTNVLGLASSFYLRPTPPTAPNVNGGIIDSEIWKTVHTGMDSYEGSISPLVSETGSGSFFHGLVAINFSNAGHNWNLNTGINCPIDKIDLYSVILHEVTHALGFASLINHLGQSRLGAGFPYFSRYDTFLQTNGGANLISSTGSCNPMYNNTFIGNVNDLRPGCNLPNGLETGPSLDVVPTSCNSTIRYFSPMQPNAIPVYTPTCYQNGSSLSHFEDSCYPSGSAYGNNQYFVMSNANGNGVTKRHLTTEERQTLCDIGYSLQNSYATGSFNQFNYAVSGSCDGIQVAGVNDGISGGAFTFIGPGTVANPIVIPINGAGGILTNDFNGITNTTNDIRIECLQDVYDNSALINGSTNAFSSTTSINSITFSSANIGTHLLRYVPIVNGVRGNITYVYVNIPLTAANFNCNTPSVCNMVNNGDFENALQNGGFNNNTLSCWQNFANSPDLFASNDPTNTTTTNNPTAITNVFTWASIPATDSHNGIAQGNFNFIGMHNNNGTQSEAAQTILNTPLVPGENYVLSFWAKVNNRTGFGNIITSNISFFSAPNFIGTTLPQNGLNANNFINDYANSFDIANVNVPNDNQWHLYSIPFTFTGTIPQNSLIIAKRDNNPNNFNQYIFVDDVSIIPVSQSTSLIMPPNVCVGQTIYDLDNYLAPAPTGGTFSGIGVSGTSFTPPTAGIYTIEYTYNNNNGCEVVIATTFEVLDCNNIISPQFPTYGPYCVGATPAVLSTVSNNGVNGVWSPATIDTSVAGTFDFTFTPTITNPSQNAETITIQITITEPSVPTFDFNSTVVCQGSSFPLPNASTNTPPIFGHWELVSNPGVTVTNINTSAIGDIDYVFISNPGCNLNETFTFSIENCEPMIIVGAEVSCEETTPNEEEPYDPEKDIHFPGDDNIVDGPCLRVCENSTIEYSLTGNTSLIASTVWNITGGSIVSSDNVHCEIQWNGAVVSHIQAVVTLNTINQDVITIDRCVEQIAQPNAEFNIIPFPVGEAAFGCMNTEVYFDNLSTANDGNGELYYYWEFGDGGTSTEFEPTHVYTQSGTFTVILTVTNGCSCLDTFTTEIVIDKGINAIECPSVVCEGEISTYNVDADCQVVFATNEGDIIGQNGNEVTIQWNNVNQSGFGTLITTAPGCTECVMATQIPVIQTNGFIQGQATICQGEQAIYNLPQWPTTDFNWNIDDFGTGAQLIWNNQRNEIIIQSNEPGTVRLSCQYYNTLLGCGGYAELEITIVPKVHLGPVEFVCLGNTQNFVFLNNSNNPVNVNYSIYEPNNPTPIQNGSNVNNFNLNPSITGYYTVEITNTNLCAKLPMEIKVIDGLNPAPTIDGDPLVCPGTPYTYVASSSNGSTVSNATLNWTITGGTFVGASTGTSVQVIFDANATPPYNVSAYYELNGCTSTTTVFEVNPLAVDVAFDNPLTEVCGSSTQNYSIVSLPTSNVTLTELDFISWSVIPANAGSIQSGLNDPNAMITWNNNATSAQLQVKVRKCGVEEIITETITINNTVPVTIAANNTVVCAESPVQFTLFGLTSYSSIDWDFGDGNTTTTFGNTPYIFTTTNIFENAASTTTYTVTATVNEPNGCPNPATATIPITVIPTPVVQLDKTKFLNLCDINTPADFVYTVPIQAGWSGSESIEWFHNGVSTGITTYSITIPDPNAPGSTVTIADVIGNYQALVTNAVNVNGTIYNCTGFSEKIVVKNQCPTGSTCSTTNDIIYSKTFGCNSATYTANPVGNPSYVFFRLSNGEIQTDNSVPFSATFSDLSPGEHLITIQAGMTPPDPTICWGLEEETFIIPYKADLKYDVVCNNGAYDVTLLDHSLFYFSTPIENYTFSIDGGTPVNITSPVALPAINQATFTGIAPGTHNFTITISSTGYAPCTFTLEDIVLPAIMPVAGFTITDINGAPLTEICEGEPVYLTPIDSTGSPVVCPDCSYNWNFLLDGAINTSQNMVKTFEFSNGDIQPISLTVSNPWGCSEPFSANIPIYEIGIDGSLKPTPVSACLGDTITLSYEGVFGSNIPNNLEWYYNTLNTPLGIGMTMNVTEPCYYFAYGLTANGCREIVDIDPINVSFIPLTAPTITGKNAICKGSGAIVLTVPTASNTTYTWQVSSNGGSSFTTIPGNTTMTYNPPITGNYIFSVVANSGGCSSAPTTHTVMVYQTPNFPLLAITNLQCNPYEVTVSVTNPQTDVVYIWSNGTIGTTAISYHDGPLQVRAELLGCSRTNQIDLPVDLSSHKWLFPDGCYNFCFRDNFNGYIIGPNEDLTEWIWTTPNGEESGSGFMSEVYVGDGQYQQYLNSGNCHETFGTASFSIIECEHCNITIDQIHELYCDQINGQSVYYISIDINNAMGSTLYTTMTAPNGEGYFSPSTITLGGGSSNYTGYFIPNNGFNGGTIDVLFQSTDGNELNCTAVDNLTFMGCDVPRMAAPKNKVVMAPNPATYSTTVYYELVAKGAIQVILTDAMGRELYTTTYPENKGSIELDISQWSPGYYTLKLIQNGETIFSDKLIKK